MMKHLKCLREVFLLEWEPHRGRWGRIYNVDEVEAELDGQGDQQ